MEGKLEQHPSITLKINIPISSKCSVQCKSSTLSSRKIAE